MGEGEHEQLAELLMPEPPPAQTTASRDLEAAQGGAGERPVTPPSQPSSPYTQAVSKEAFGFEEVLRLSALRRALSAAFLKFRAARGLIPLVPLLQPC